MSRGFQPALKPVEFPPVQTCHPGLSIDCFRSISDRLDAFNAALPAGFLLPTRNTITRLFLTYFNTFHQQYPILHTPTLSFQPIRLELFLAIAAVGAQYSSECELSRELYEASRAIVSIHLQAYDHSSPFEQDEAPSTKSPPDDRGHIRNMEMVQTLVLLIATATSSGRETIENEVSSLCKVLKSLIHTEKGRLSCVPKDWVSWTRAAAFKHICLTAFCHLNLSTIMFNIPTMIFPSEMDIDLCTEEVAWQADNERIWEKSIRPGGACNSFYAVFRRLSEGNNIATGCVEGSSSPLIGLALIHAIFQHINIIRTTGVPHHKKQLILVEEVELLNTALRIWSSHWTCNKQASTKSSHRSRLVSTSMCILRLAYVRLAMHYVPWYPLDTKDPKLIAFTIDRYSSVRRSRETTYAALHCAHVLSIPVKVGIRLVAQRKTVYWSSEQALCSLECAILLIKWLQAVFVPNPSPPLSPDEKHVLEITMILLAEANYMKSRFNASQGPLLGAAMSRLWAALYAHQTPCGVAGLVGESLAVYADILERRYLATDYMMV